ncbi:hypothetical protein LCGC14_2471340, partial [marine sediment metagenome]
MSDTFDPYQAWLRISPEEQPPHHYRLLGLDPFEEKAQVIERAAGRRDILGVHLALRRYVEKNAKALTQKHRAEAKAKAIGPKAFYMLKQIIRNIPERPANTAEERENYIVVLKRINGLVRN